MGVKMTSIHQPIMAALNMLHDGCCAFSADIIDLGILISLEMQFWSEQSHAVF